MSFKRSRQKSIADLDSSGLTEDDAWMHGSGLLINELGVR